MSLILILETLFYWKRFYLKKVLFSMAIAFFYNSNLFAQNVSISDINHTPHNSAMLDVYSSSKGLLLPNVNLSLNPIASPAAGLLVWNTTNAGGFFIGYYYYNGSTWVKVGSGVYTFENGISETVGNIVRLGGSLTDNTSITQDNFQFKIENNGSQNTLFDLTSDGDFSVKSNGINSLFVRDDGNVGIGTSSPTYRLYVSGTGDNTRKATAFITNTNPDYDGASALYAMQAPTSGGTNWGLLYAKAGIKGCTYNGYNYSAGVAGYRYDDDQSQSAGVFGAASLEDNPKVWGALGFKGYQNGSLYNYAGYFNGDVAISRNVVIDGEYINFDTIIGENGYGFRERGGTIEYKNQTANWTPLPTPPPSGSSTEWWYKPSGKFFIQPLSNNNIRVYDAGQDTGFYYNGYSNKIAGFFRTTSGADGTSAVQGFSDVSNKKTKAYLGYNGNYSAFIKTGTSLSIDGASVYGVVDDADRVSIFGRTTGNASYSAIIGYSDSWIAGYYLAKDSSGTTYGGRPALYGQLTTKLSKNANVYQPAIKGYSEYTGLTNTGFTIGGQFSAIGGTQDSYGIYVSASSSALPIGAYIYTNSTTTVGTGYTDETIGPTAIIGYNPHSGRTGSSANTYQFGIVGEKDEDYSGSYYYDLRSGGVLGTLYRVDNTTVLAWGALGYKSSADVNYGVYSTTAFASGGGKANSSYNGVGIGAFGGLMGGWFRGNVYGLSTKGDRYAIYADGDVISNDKFIILAKEKESTAVPLYANVATSVDIYMKGISSLDNGKGSVAFDKNVIPHISDSIPIIVTVTPMGSSQGIYINTVSKNGFEVSENNSGKSNVTFSWIAIATRKGYENPKIPKEILSNDFNKNLEELMLNENDTNSTKRNYFWWDGEKLRTDAPVKTMKSPLNNNKSIKKKNSYSQPSSPNKF